MRWHIGEFKQGCNSWCHRCSALYNQSRIVNNALLKSGLKIFDRWRICPIIYITNIVPHSLLIVLKSPSSYAVKSCAIWCLFMHLLAGTFVPILIIMLWNFWKRFVTLMLLWMGNWRFMDFSFSVKLCLFVRLERRFYELTAESDKGSTWNGYRLHTTFDGFNVEVSRAFDAFFIQHSMVLSPHLWK